MLNQRISIFVSLPFEKLSKLLLQRQLTEIERAAAGGVEAPRKIPVARTELDQVIEQGPRLLQVKRVETLGEPPISCGEKIVSLPSFALIAPKPGHAHRRAQFPGLCLLLTRNTETVVRAPAEDINRASSFFLGYKNEGRRRPVVRFSERSRARSREAEKHFPDER